MLTALRKFIRLFKKPAPVAAEDIAPALRRTRQVMQDRPHPLTAMSDAALAKFNALLPWAAMTVDCAGRIVGRAAGTTKRAAPQQLIESRQKNFDQAFPFKGRHVMEIGCFEGIHTMGLLLLGARVTAADGRIENVLKTQARLWAYGQACPLLLWDVEQPPGPLVPDAWDILHHIGVLYHLATPVEHLEAVLPRTRMAVLLDTHVCETIDAVESHSVSGRVYRHHSMVQPKAKVSPFAGLRDHAKYLLLEDLLAILEAQGFSDRRVVSNRVERNGRRVTIWAFRDGVLAPDAPPPVWQG